MKKAKSRKNFYETMQSRIQKELKLYKRKKFVLKAKIFLLFVLPVVIVMLAAKAASVWLGLKLKQVKLSDEPTVDGQPTDEQAAYEKPVIRPVQQETLENEFITPEPVSTSTT